VKTRIRKLLLVVAETGSGDEDPLPEINQNRPQFITRHGFGVGMDN
jgi:hypothetical protein